MNRRDFSKTVVALSGVPLLSSRKATWSVRLLRHATLIVETSDAKLLIDPMFSPKGSMDPIGNAGNDIRIPMADLPVNDEQLTNIVKGVDAILLTHTHRDHWDVVAQKLIDRSKPVFCQPDDLGKLKGQGFIHTYAIEDSTEYNNFTIYRTGGQHGTSEIGEKMGPVSGFVIKEGDKALYIAGDTVWCNEVERTLQRFKPQTVVVNAGGAQFLAGDPITMDADDVMTISKALPRSSVIAVHMDTINHCKVTRDTLRKFVAENNLSNVRIPDDGMTLSF